MLSSERSPHAAAVSETRLRSSAYSDSAGPRLSAWSSVLALLRHIAGPPGKARDEACADHGLPVLVPWCTALLQPTPRRLAGIPLRHHSPLLGSLSVVVDSPARPVSHSGSHITHARDVQARHMTALAQGHCSWLWRMRMPLSWSGTVQHGSPLLPSVVAHVRRRGPRQARTLRCPPTSPLRASARPAHGCGRGHWCTRLAATQGYPSTATCYTSTVRLASRPASRSPSSQKCGRNAAPHGRGGRRPPCVSHSTLPTIEWRTCKNHRWARNTCTSHFPNRRAPLPMLRALRSRQTLTCRPRWQLTGRASIKTTGAHLVENVPPPPCLPIRRFSGSSGQLSIPLS